MTHRLRALHRPAVAGRPRRPVRWWHRLLPPPLVPAAAPAGAGRPPPAADRVGRWPRLLLALGLAVVVATDVGALTTDAGAARATLTAAAGAASSTVAGDASAASAGLTTDVSAMSSIFATTGAAGRTPMTQIDAAGRTLTADIGTAGGKAGSGSCPTGHGAPAAGCVAGSPAGAPGRVTAGRWGWPLAGRPPVLRRFDPPASPYGPGHRGVDLGGAPGDLVLAAGPGTVVYAGVLASRGVVSIQHPGGLRTTYEPLAVAVEQGEVVSRGTVLGRLLAGHSGCPWPACLHWGLRRGETYLDPLSLIRRGPVRLLPRLSRDPGG